MDAPGVNKYLTSELANHYRAGLTDIPGTHVYYWVYNSAFKNENVWWRYDNKTYTLVMGVYDPLGNCVVEEFGDTLPWVGSIDTEASNRVENVVTYNVNGGRIAPKSLEGWFEDYKSLITFDGTGPACR